MTPICKEIRREILNIGKVSKHGHLPTCFSVVELIYAVYDTMKHNPKNPFWEERDIFILSKGHASLAQYCILAIFGYFNIKDIYSFGGFMSRFGCHPDRFKVPGIEVSTGSLGHGIGIAVGIALAFKIQKIERRVFVLIGDGEANEGSVWEAIMVATNLKLANLTIIYDDNKSHLRGLQIYNAASKFRAFDCEVSEVNGHDVFMIKEELIKKSSTVKVIVADTKKGYGCKTFVENPYEWHRKAPNDDEFNRLIKELDEEAI